MERKVLISYRSQASSRGARQAFTILQNYLVNKLSRNEIKLSNNLYNIIGGGTILLIIKLDNDNAARIKYPYLLIKSA